jgi:hypothetical protein
VEGPGRLVAAWAAIIGVIVAIYFGCQAHQDAQLQGGASNKVTPSEAPGSLTGTNSQPAQTEPSQQSTPTTGIPCSRDLSSGYPIVFSYNDQCAQSGGTLTYDLNYNQVMADYHGLLHLETMRPGRLAVLDAAAPSYQGCQNDTRYEAFVDVPEGTVFCFTGHGVVAGVKIVKHHPILSQNSTDYLTLDITVWQGQ